MENITVISTGDKTTKTNKPYKSLTVRQENGTEHKVNIWSDFPNFANVTIGTVIRGKIEQNGKYMNLVSELQTKPQGGAGTAFKTAQIEKVMDTKRQDIARSQENKDWSIRVSSTMRDAVQLAIAEYTINKQSLDRLDECVLKWRKWLLENWEINEKDYNPF